MGEKKDQNKFTELAVQQNLLLWQLSKSFIDIDKQLKEVFSINRNDRVKFE